MIPVERPELRVVAISARAGRDPSERRRLAALGARGDIALSVVTPAATLDLAASGDEAFLRMPVRRWGPGVRSGRLDTVAGLRDTLKRLQPDVIHVHQEPGSLLALQAIRLRDRVARQAAVLVESEQADMNLTTGASTHLERHVLRQADALVVRHKVRLELARAQGFAGHGVVVGYGVDRGVFRPGLRAAAREAVGVTGFVIGYLGRLEPESGLADVLEAIAASKAQVTLLIKAQGPSHRAMRDELVDRAASLDILERVRFIEANEAVDDATFLGALDALVMMRRSVRRWREPFEQVIPEAQACGVPVIASGLSGIPTLVGPGGWIVGERDAGLLARLLHCLATQPEATQAVATAGLAHVGQHASLDAVTQELRRAFDTAVQARQLHCAQSPRGWLGISPVPQSYRR